MKHCIMSMVFYCISQFTFAQSITINGTVYSDNQAIIGATVYNTNQNIGTTTAQDGSFGISGTVGDTLQISYLGYMDLYTTVPSNNNQNLRIDLKESDISLDEIVITALGLERSTKDLGYAVQKLDSEQLTRVKSVNLLDNLTAKVAGLSITQGATGVGSSSIISIRGASSFTNNNPLFVVDGIPINNTTDLNLTNEIASGFQEIDFGNGAMDINPDDIASINVLKGPGAAALYGTRASNGVIVIETKDGSSTQGVQVAYNTSFLVDRPFQLPEFQNTYGQGNSGEFTYVDGLGGGINDNITYSYGPQLDIGLNIAQFDSPVTLNNGDIVRGGDIAVHGGLPITPTPWVSNPDNLKNFYETGTTLMNHLAISNGNEKGHYRFSFGDMRSDSYIPGVNLDRQTFQANLAFNPTTKLNIHASGNYIYTTSDNRPASGYGSENINYSLVAWLGRQSNLNSLKDYWQPGLEGLQQYSFNYTFFDNPYFILLENRNAFDRNRILGNIRASYQVNDQLSIQVRTGLDNKAEDRTFRRAFSSNRFKNGAYAEQNIGFRESNTDILATYHTKMGNMGINLSAGANRMRQMGRNSQTQAIGLAQPGIFKLSNAAVPLEIFQNDFEKAINSVYALAKLSYKDLLFLDITGRNDWSSALATPSSTENTSFFYPSVSSALIVSKIIDLPTSISFLKVRASWAQVGNDTNPYQTVGVYNASTPVGGLPTFSAQNFIPNTDLQPEQISAIELGTDIRLIDDRVGIDFTYYNSLNENQIISLPIPISSGYNNRVINGGSVRSRGIEVLLDYTPIRRANFGWSTLVNFSHNTSTVESLPDGAKSLTLAYSRVYDNPNQTVWFIVEEGGEIGDLWGTGYLKNENGDFVINQDGGLIVDNTLKKLGNSNPDFTLGWSNQLRYKQVSLGFVVDWRQGGQLVSRTQALAGVGGQLAETEFRPDEGLVFDGVVNVGSDENPNYIENTTPISAESYYRQFYDRNHEENNTYDASFIKLREVNLTFDLCKWLSQRLTDQIDVMTFSLIGRNLFALSDIPHFDPEQVAVQGNTFVRGVEDMSYPTAKSIGASLKIHF